VDRFLWDWPSRSVLAKPAEVAAHEPVWCQPRCTTVLRSERKASRVREASEVLSRSSSSHARFDREWAHLMQTVASGWLPRRTILSPGDRLPQHQHCEGEVPLPSAAVISEVTGQSMHRLGVRNEPLA